MNRSEAVSFLSSTSTHLRLKGARFLARNAELEDLSVLRQYRSVESNSYVKASLDRGIARLTDDVPLKAEDTVDDSEITDRGRRQIYATATEWIAGLILHEIASPLGLVSLAAKTEVPNYEASRTKRYLGSLQEIFKAIEQLKTASATPKPEEFDLATLIDDIVASEFVDRAELIAIQGPKPLLLVSDVVLLRFAICNGLRNAIEASMGVAVEAPSPVVITWGETDVDYWVSVLDRGPGVAGSTDAIFEMGKTTKKGHSGFGLPIARAAMDALEGTVTLQSVADGVTKYELRWEKWPHKF